MTALGRKLKSRGHEVVFICLPDAEPAVRAAKLDFVPFCEKEYPAGAFNKQWSKIATLHGPEVLWYTGRELMEAARIAYHGVGEFVEFDELTVERLSELIQTVRKKPSYLEKARVFQNLIARRRGLEVAADVIEHALEVDRQVGLAAGRRELSHV
jgi:UDP:flavonoid glycosyltransferase YjiC (YdhE family)